MQKELCLVIALALVNHWVASTPVNLGTLEFDNLDTDIANLKYEVEEEDLDDFSKLLDEADQLPNTAQNQTKTNVKASGSKNKKTANAGVKANRNIQDLKKFFKQAGAHDDGTFDDNAVFAIAEGAAGQAVTVDGNENRTYKKGTKTRGFHRVHHKDEYKKDRLFYEDDIVNGSIKKNGSKGRGFVVGAGAGFGRGRIHRNRSKGVYGKQGYSDQGSLNKEVNTYADSQGFDATFNNDS